jgi:hypothetical protein
MTLVEATQGYDVVRSSKDPASGVFADAVKDETLCTLFRDVSLSL